MKISNETKLKLYPVAIAVMGIGLLVLFFTRIDIILPTSPPEAAAPEPIAPPAPSASPTIEPSSKPSPSPTPTPTPVPTSPSPSAVAGDRQGSLKVSNQTLHPVRVALLFQQVGNKSAGQPAYSQPVHWDFAPGEGGNNGLLMSLPDGDLKIRSGDVLMAFAEDGSRRYWGPFVVGKTDLPTWNGTQREWTLLLLQ